MKKLILQATIGILLGVSFFFIGNTTRAITIDNTDTTIDDRDVIATELSSKGDFIKLQYYGDFKTEDGFTPINEYTSRSNSNPNSYRVYSGDTFIEDRELGVWFNIEYATTTLTEYNKYLDEKLISRFKFILPAIADTVYSDSGDGDIYKLGDTWNQAHDATTGESLDDTSVDVHLATQITGAGKYNCRRLFFPFDTSGLDYTDKYVASTSLFFYPYSISETGTIEFTIHESTASVPATLALADFDAFNSTELAPRLAVGAGAQYYEYVFNSSGLATINESGWSDYMLTSDLDTDDTSPVDSVLEIQANIYTSEQTGTANDPYLLVTLKNDPLSEATSTIVVESEMPVYNDIGIITARTLHYETSTATPDWYEDTVYHIPFFVWLVFWLIFSTLLSRFLLEIIIRFRRK